VRLSCARQIGEVSELVDTESGVHIIKRIE
jgi:hypothetical protein